MEARTDRPELGSVRPQQRRLASAEDSVEVRRYLDALRRSKWLILMLVLITTVTTVAVSLWLPKRYTASSSIVKETTAGPYDAVNVESLTRELQTIQRLLVTFDVLDRARHAIPGETVGGLAASIKSSVDPNANLLYIDATAGDPRLAAARSNAVATAFVDEQRDITRQQYARARAGLLQELNRVQGQPDGKQQQTALRQRLSELTVSQANAGTDLQVAERAPVPGSPTSPRPMRNGVIAFFLALFLAVLVALGRDQLVPRVGGTRELGRLLDLPMLTAIPYVRRRLGRRRRMLSGIEHESYQTLGASVRFSLPADSGPQILLVTSALHAEGKSTVTARLGRALTQSGQRTLLVSADLRWPTLHHLMDVPESPGLSDLLNEYNEHGDGPELNVLLDQCLIALESGPRQGELDILPSGRKPSEPAQLLSGDGLDVVFDRLTRMDYDYVLVDGPPTLGIADTQSLARCTRHLLYVARLDRITLDNVMDARDVLDRLEAEPIGFVAIGARGEASPYYVGARNPAFDDA
jgi:Mrp family chromosome partitioning ATPase/capsular polysaccharide biosynthesis protein